MVAYNDNVEWIQLNDYYLRTNKINVKKGVLEEKDVGEDKDINIKIDAVDNKMITHIIDKVVDDELIERVLMEIRKNENNPFVYESGVDIIEGFDIKKEAKEVMEKIANEIKPALESQLKKITIQLQSELEDLKRQATQSLMAVQKKIEDETNMKLSGVKNTIMKEINELKEDATKTLKMVQKKIEDETNMSLSGIKDTILKEINQIKNVVLREVDEIKDKIVKEVNEVVDKALSEVKKFIDKLENFADMIEEKVEGLITKLKDQINGVVDKIEEQISQIKNKIEDGIDKIENTTKKIISDIKNISKDVIEETGVVFKKLEDIFKELFEILKKLVHEIALFTGTFFKEMTKFFNDPGGYTCRHLKAFTGLSCTFLGLFIVCNIYYFILNFTPPGKLSCDIINEMTGMNFCLYLFLNMSFVTTLWFYLPKRYNIVQHIMDLIYFYIIKPYIDRQRRKMSNAVKKIF